MKIRKFYQSSDGSERLTGEIHDFKDQATMQEIYTLLDRLAPGMYTFEEGKVVYNGFHFKCTYIPCED